MPNALLIKTKLAVDQSSRRTNSVLLIIDRLSMSSLQCPFWAISVYNPSIQKNSGLGSPNMLFIRQQTILLQIRHGTAMHMLLFDAIDHSWSADLIRSQRYPLAHIA